VPSLLSARKNPDERELRDVLPPELYARWLVQKKRYLGRESGVERWRPLFAADKLRKAAFEDLRMRERGAIWDEIGDAIAKAKIKVTTPTLKFTFKRSEVRDKIKEFSRESLDDLRCFAETLALTEALANQDVENARAKAWAAGDVQAMAALPALPSPYLPCALAIMKSQVASDVIPADLPERVAALWVEHAGRSLETNSVTFAVVPFPKLVRPDGYLDALRARGLRVEAPQ
jgi:TraB/PrgY/gumN family